MSSFLRDLRYAARHLLRSPGFTAVVVATLALGIGANTAIFSVVDAVLLERLPYDEPDRLVAIWADVSARGGPEDEWLNYEDLASLVEEPGLLEAGASWSTWRPTLVGRGDAEVVEGGLLSHQMLGRVLRATPELGRFFEPSDDVPGAAGVVVLSYASWQQRFGADPGIVGTVLMLSDVPHEVIGVAAPGFEVSLLPDAEIFRAMGVLGDPGCGRGCFGVRAIGRLAPDVPLELARDRARDLGARLASAYPDSNTGLTFSFVGLHDEVTGSSARALWVLLGAVALVLLIACTNVANLLLIRGAAREAELGVRVAIGAGRGSIVRQLLAESLLLAGAGGLAGLLVASWSTDALLALAPVPRADEVGLDAAVLVFTAALTVATGVLFGLVPAWRASRPALYSAIRLQGGAGGGRGYLRGGLVVAEIGTALVLLVGAGLLLRSFQRLTTTDFGFEEPERVLTFRVAVPGSRYTPEERLTFFGTLVERVRAIPGVDVAGAVNSLPLAGVNSDTDFLLEGEPPPVPGVSQAIWLRPMLPGYFETIGLDVTLGRGLQEADDARAPLSLVVNESFVDRYFGGDVLGKRIAFNGDPATATWWTIVGVARDVRHFAIRSGVAAGADPTAQPDAPAAYLPYAQAYRTFAPAQMAIVAHVQGDPAALTTDVRRALRALDPALAASAILPLSALVDGALARDRFVTILLSLFAATALALAALGIYGVVSYGVNRRIRELGIRRALGAEAADLGLMIVGGGLRLAGVGIAVGVVGALVLTRVLGSLLYDVGATDPLTFSGMALLLTAVATLASWLPTRRIQRVDPVTVLRSE